MPYEQRFVTKTYVRPGGIIHRITTLDDLLHAGPFDDEPSVATYDEDGNPMNFVWHESGLEHRTNGPARIVFHQGTDLPATEVFKIQGKPCDDGPYMVRRRRDGSVWKMERADGSVIKPDIGSPEVEPP